MAFESLRENHPLAIARIARFDLAVVAFVFFWGLALVGAYEWSGRSATAKSPVTPTEQGAL